MNFEYDEIDLLLRSLIIFEEEYISLIYSWETYKRIFENHKIINSGLTSPAIRFSLSVISSALIKESWSNIIRIWDKKTKCQNNMSLHKAHEVIKTLTHTENSNLSRVDFKEIKGCINQMVIKQNNIKDRIQNIRNDHLSHKNLGSLDKIKAYPPGTRFDQLFIDHTLIEFDNFYKETGEIISLFYKILDRNVNQPNRDHAIRVCQEGADELIEKILYEQKKG
ncbi:hypothetical protein [Acetobacter persici]|uniref:hypothetical protein n=1 Tax=Acetobacter persici TaxID=1076596 RepID=UPI001F1A72CB|nr:hypothetical protein [Acetobacter persici]MCG0996849.1 hypothetical protein [Acetobacter persici]